MPKSKAKNAKKGKANVGSSGLTTTLGSQIGQRKGTKTGSSPNMSLPKSTIHIPPPSNSMELRGPTARSHWQGFSTSYVAGFVVSGSSGTAPNYAGSALNLFFVPGLNGIPANWSGLAPVCTTAVPVAPADIASISDAFTGSTALSGYGSTAINDLFSLFVRVRFNSIRIRFEPFAIGSASTGGAQCTFAPMRGSINGAYTVSQSNAATPKNDIALLSMEDSCSFPTWTPKVFDLTKYIAGGSGPKQNEFYQVGNQYGTVGPALPASTGGTSWDAKGVIPVSFFVGGQNPQGATSVFKGQPFMIVRMEMNVDLLDWMGDNGYVSGTIAGLSSRSASVSAQKVSIASPAVPASTGSAASASVVAAPSEKDEKQPPLDTRGYWFSSKPPERLLQK